MKVVRFKPRLLESHFFCYFHSPVIGNVKLSHHEHQKKILGELRAMTRRDMLRWLDVEHGGGGRSGV